MRETGEARPDDRRRVILAQSETHQLDPRTGIVLVLATSAAVMSPDGLVFVPVGVLLATGLAVWEGAWRRAFGLVGIAVGLWFFGWLVPLWWTNGFTAIVSLACSYGIRFVAALGVGMHLVTTISPSRLAAGLRAWRIPRPISVTLVVMLRVFPIVGAEAAAVLDAMRLRGLIGARGLLRHPVLTLERFTVPMIAASLRASEDLSASAILRGLGSRTRPTSMNPPRFARADLIIVLTVTILTLASLTLPKPLS